jgi:hypothetical protein
VKVEIRNSFSRSLIGHHHIGLEGIGVFRLAPAYWRKLTRALCWSGSYEFRTTPEEDGEEIDFRTHDKITCPIELSPNKMFSCVTISSPQVIPDHLADFFVIC